MASQSTGIQQLLAAEKRAAEKVEEARKRKIQYILYVLHCGHFDAINTNSAYAC